jgi:hypothetical protein
VGGRKVTALTNPVPASNGFEGMNEEPVSGRVHAIALVSLDADSSKLGDGEATARTFK